MDAAKLQQQIFAKAKAIPLAKDQDSHRVNNLTNKDSIFSGGTQTNQTNQTNLGVSFLNSLMKGY